MTWQLYSIGRPFLASTQVISEDDVAIVAITDEQRRLLSTGGGFSRIDGPDGQQISADSTFDPAFPALDPQ